MAVQAPAGSPLPSQSYNPFAPPCHDCSEKHMINVITHQCLDNDPLGCDIKAIPNTVPLDLKDYIRVGDILKLLDEAHDPLVEPDAPSSTLTSTSSSSLLKPSTTKAPNGYPTTIVVTLTNLPTTKTAAASPVQSSSVSTKKSRPGSKTSNSPAAVFTTGSPSRVPDHNRGSKRSAIPTEHGSTDPTSEEIQPRSARTITMAELTAHKNLRKVLKIKQNQTSSHHHHHRHNKRDTSIINEPIISIPQETLAMFLDHLQDPRHDFFPILNRPDLDKDTTKPQAISKLFLQQTKNPKSDIFWSIDRYTDGIKKPQDLRIPESLLPRLFQTLVLENPKSSITTTTTTTPPPSDPHNEAHSLTIHSNSTTTNENSIPPTNQTPSPNIFTNLLLRLPRRIEPPHHPFPPPPSEDDPVIPARSGRELVDMLFMAGIGCLFVFAVGMYVLQRVMRGYYYHHHHHHHGRRSGGVGMGMRVFSKAGGGGKDKDQC
ncbi:hypothetical protein DM02DRAFT_633169 [Periconia macrospinosa]|uniref:Uncharacterized protein n=1 Tax=Periconia macrospinosa TaxID=97972 RepID=A0A2V1DAF0_9PLEO|nr:hypothetical protein DM02DRAFT_633169 [Periconia macrospinosa]